MPDNDDGMKMTLALPEGDVEFDPTIHLTRHVLSQVKRWYGRTDLWQLWPFRQALGMGEPNAAACAIWAVKRHDGVSPNPEPPNIGRKIGDPTDFAIGRVVLAPNRNDEQSSPRWILTPEDDERYELAIDDDVSVAMMRQIQKWYPHLSSVVSLWQGLIQGDFDAVGSAVWVCRLNENLRRGAAGEPLIPNPNPRDMEDFSVLRVSPFENIDRLNDDAIYQEHANPTTTGADRAAGTPTTTSTGSTTETPTTSGFDGLGQ